MGPDPRRADLVDVGEVPGHGEQQLDRIRVPGLKGETVKHGVTPQDQHKMK